MGSENEETLDAVAYESMPERTFEEWMDALEALALGKYGLAPGDFPLDELEANYRRGVSPLAYLMGAIQWFFKGMRQELDTTDIDALTSGNHPFDEVFGADAVEHW